MKLNDQLEYILGRYHDWLTSTMGMDNKTNYPRLVRKALLKFSSGSLLGYIRTLKTHDSKAQSSALSRFCTFLDLHPNLVHIDDEALLADLAIELYLSRPENEKLSAPTKQIYRLVLKSYFINNISQPGANPDYARSNHELLHLKEENVMTWIKKHTSSPHELQYLAPTRNDDSHIRDREEKSAHTIKLYRIVMQGFVRFLLTLKETKDLESLSSEEKRIHAQLAHITRKTLLQILAIKLKAPKDIKRKAPMTLRERQLLFDHLLSVVKEHERKKDEAYLQALSFAARFVLMAWNGLRPVEVTRLQWSDVDLESKRLAVQGSGRSKKEKVEVHLFKTTRNILRRYYNACGQPHGRNALFKNMTVAKMADEFKRITASVLPGKNDKKAEVYTLETLRHTAGQLLYDSGVGLDLIQRTLRHSTLNQTMRYAEVKLARDYFKDIVDDY